MRRCPTCDGFGWFAVVNSPPKAKPYLAGVIRKHRCGCKAKKKNRPANEET